MLGAGAIPEHALDCSGAAPDDEEAGLWDAEGRHVQLRDPRAGDGFQSATVLR